jgi:hypothetical protein
VTDDLSSRLRSLGADPASWSNGPRDAYAAHEHGYDKTIACDSGSITFGLVDLGRRVELRPGDRLDLPAGTTHDALVGDEGVTCLESHFPAGHYVGVNHRRAGEW